MSSINEILESCGGAKWTQEIKTRLLEAAEKEPNHVFLRRAAKYYGTPNSAFPSLTPDDATVAWLLFCWRSR